MIGPDPFCGPIGYGLATGTLVRSISYYRVQLQAAIRCSPCILNNFDRGLRKVTSIKILSAAALFEPDYNIHNFWLRTVTTLYTLIQ